MKNLIIFLSVTVTIAIFAWLLVGILIGAPELGEKIPMTLVQNIASYVMLITFLPGLLLQYFSHALGWDMPAASFSLLIIISAIVWAAVILLVIKKVLRKKSSLRPE
jgi:hypothetical protein